MLIVADSNSVLIGLIRILLSLISERIIISSCTALSKYLLFTLAISIQQPGIICLYKYQIIKMY